MATKKKEAEAPVSMQGEDDIQILSTNSMTIQVRVIGTSLLCLHNWSEKAKKEMRDKQQQKAKAPKAAKNPRLEYEGCFYFDPDTKSKNVIPAIHFKKALIGAAHNDFKLPKTKVAQNVFVEGVPSMMYSEIEGLPWPVDHPEIEDTVRVSGGTADLRYRPKWPVWATTIKIRFHNEVISPEQLIQLLDRAGRCVGVAEGRAQKQSGLDWGMFAVDLNSIKIEKDEANRHLKIAETVKNILDKKTA